MCTRFQHQNAKLIVSKFIIHTDRTQTKSVLQMAEYGKGPKSRTPLQPMAGIPIQIGHGSCKNICHAVAPI
jgi:hypothetical protein